MTRPYIVIYRSNPIGMNGQILPWKNWFYIDQKLLADLIKQINEIILKPINRTAAIIKSAESIS